MGITALWDVIPCSLVEIDRQLESFDSSNFRDKIRSKFNSTIKF